MNKRLKIIFVSPSGYGGPTHLYGSLVAELNTEGLDCTLARGLTPWIRLHFSCDYDVVVTALPFFWRPSCGTFVANIHGDYRAQQSVRSIGALLAYLYPYTVRIADKLLFPSAYLRRVLGFQKCPNSSVIPNFTDMDNVFLTKRGDGGRERLPHKVICVTKFDFFDKSKGILKVIDALSRVGLPIDFEIIGGGRFLDAMKIEASKFSLPDDLHIEWRGFLPRDQIFEKLASSKLFLYASYLDTFSISTLEAISVGLPVIINDYGPFPELFPHLATDLNDWPKKIQTALSDSRYSNELATAGVSDIESFSKRNVIGMWVGYLKSLSAYGSGDKS